MKKILFGFLGILTLSFSSGYAQYKFENIDSLINSLHLEQGFDGNILIADKGEIVYEKSFGFANDERKIPLTENSIFNLASVSKVFTAVATMKLIEEGKLTLTDSLQRYFPDMSYPGITIYNLLTHTSGLQDFQADPVREQLGKNATNQDIETAYTKVHLKTRFTPDSNWGYSNTNYLLLAMIIEKVSGMSYPDFISKSIFIPSGMDHSFVLMRNAPPALRDQLASIYYYPDFLSIRPSNVDSIAFTKMYYSIMGNEYGDRGVFSTTKDLFRFHNALQTGKILKKPTLNKMYMRTLLSGGKDYEAGNANPDFASNYGLGWIVVKDSSIGKIVWHSGSDPGTLTFYMRNITRDQCVVVLNNKWYRGTYHLGGSLMNLINGRPSQLMAPSLARKIGQEYTVNGSAIAIKLLDSLKRGSAYHIGLLEMNELGYNLLAKNDTRSAIEIFKVNTEQYPTSGDVWDSLAEAYYKSGDKETAIKDYEKSILLDPHNESGKATLKKSRLKLTVRGNLAK
jgi:CubicO group peptidase (beta-lactamase class C family)